MTNLKSMKRVLITVAIFLVAEASFVAIPGRGSQPSQDPANQKPSSDEAVALRDALRRGGLREAAKLKGHVVIEYNPHWDIGPLSVEALTKTSAAVIVGRFTKKLPARLLDGRVIYRDYEVAVEELVKGKSSQAKR
jgi:hypothetical protein